jgi:hemerythrin superfamily protein
VPDRRFGRALSGYRRVMDAITLLRHDHKVINTLFRKFEQAGERAEATKADLAGRIVRELSVHASIEEQVFYPAVLASLPNASHEILENLEEHHVVKWLCSEIDRMTPADERFDAKMRVLIELVRLHVKEEESSLFSEVRRSLGRKELSEIGEALQTAKRTAPVRPHPRLRDTPPANLVMGGVVSVLDRALDAGQKVMNGASR